MSRLRLFIPWLLTSVAMVLLLQVPAAGQDGFPDVCQKGQLLQNCDFGQGLNGWQSFIESGAVSFSTVDGGACHSPLCPAAFLVASGSFVGGLYQQVPAVPGTTYWANITWLVFEPAGKLDNTVGRRVGIDPTGGTDPRSPSVVWSQALWRSFEGCAYKICPELQVSATAQNSTITVFVRIESTWKDRRDEFAYVPAAFFDMEDQFWVDDVGLIALDGAPAPPSPTSVPTQAPPTDTPVPPAAPATNTPLPPSPTPPPESTEPAAVVQVDTPTPAPTPSPTTAPTATPSPTITPLPPTPTPTRPPTATPTPTPGFPGMLGVVGGGMICLGGAGVVVALGVGGFLFWLYRLGTSDQFEDEEFVDQEIGGSGYQETGESGDQEAESLVSIEDDPES